MGARCRAPDRLMRVNACGEEAGKMAEVARSWLWHGRQPRR